MPNAGNPLHVIHPGVQSKGQSTQSYQPSNHAYSVASPIGQYDPHLAAAQLNAQSTGHHPSYPVQSTLPSMTQYPPLPAAQSFTYQKTTVSTMLNGQQRSYADVVKYGVNPHQTVQHTTTVTYHGANPMQPDAPSMPSIPMMSSSPIGYHPNQLSQIGQLAAVLQPHAQPQYMVSPFDSHVAMPGSPFVNMGNAIVSGHPMMSPMHGQVASMPAAVNPLMPAIYGKSVPIQAASPTMQPTMAQRGNPTTLRFNPNLHESFVRNNLEAKSGNIFPPNTPHPNAAFNSQLPPVPSAPSNPAATIAYNAHPPSQSYLADPAMSPMPMAQSVIRVA